MLSISNHQENANESHTEESPSALVKWLKPKRQRLRNAGKDVEKKALRLCEWDCKLMHLLYKAIWRFLQKIRNRLSR